LKSDIRIESTKASSRISLIVAAFCLVVWAATAQASEHIYYFHNDQLGTPQAMTDAAGRTVWTAEYDPFGKAVVNEDPDSNGQPVVNNLRFPGQYYDAETGLHYNWHRDYDPDTGRYLTPDPIGLDGGLNLYSYGEQNPVIYIDPDGENPGAGAAVGFLVGGPPGAAVGAAVGLIGGINIGDYVWDQWIHRDDKCASEHKKDKRKSTWDKHTKRRSDDPERGDSYRRPPRKRPPDYKGPWPPRGSIYEDEDH
jgi:RHS repeat-associated protein